MPRECPHAFRSARAVAGTDSAKRTSALRPSAIGPVRCRVPLCKKREDASVTQTSSYGLRVITAVRCEMLLLPSVCPYLRGKT
jgi:hypothetical protein